MDKRGAKILISCILCTVIVLVLFIIALRFSRMTCELISIDPQQLRQAQLESFNGNKKHKPTRSYDKMILMKMSAYLEYNIMQTGPPPSSSEKPASWGATNNGNEPTGGNNNTTLPVAGSNNQVQQQQQQFTGAVANQQQQAGANLNGNLSPRPGGLPNQQLGLAATTTATANQQQLVPNNSTYLNANNPLLQSGQQRASERFLPIYLESIETRSLSPPDGPANNLITKQKYILSFNCTKLNMVFAYQGNRVYVESMSLELSPASRQKTTCELQLPSSGAFAVDSSLSSSTTSNLQHANFAHYYCNKTLSYNCYHYSAKNGPSPTQGMLLAELHINSIEFETYTGSINGNSNNNSNQHKNNSNNKHNNKHHSREHKHVEHEFKTKPMVCVVPTDQAG